MGVPGLVQEILPMMGETGLVSSQTVADVLDTLKFDRDEFLSKLAEELGYFLTKLDPLSASLSFSCVVWALERDRESSSTKEDTSQPI